MIQDNTIAIILGGGVGSRLYPLTKERSKPAVPIAGKFRLIDIPISNCLNWGIKRMFVLTQFNSASLNRHIKNAYHFDSFSPAFVDILAAEQTTTSMEWFQGTADAVRQSVPHVAIYEFDYLMVLSGDQLYQMDLLKLLEFHKEKQADLTVATIPVTAQEASGFGIMKVDNDSMIVDFIEKPASDILDDWKSPLPEEYVSEGKEYVASMGIYVFTRGKLSKLFEENPKAIDFGKEIIPFAVESDQYAVASFPYGGYWTDIGTISSFFEANIRLTHYLPEFNLYDNKRRIYTRSRMLSPSKVFGTTIDQSLFGGGSIIHADLIRHSVIGIRSRIGKRTIIERSYLMGIDFYQTVKELETLPEKELLGVGEDCFIKNAIIDKNVRVGDRCHIVGDGSLQDAETPEYCIREGIIIIKKNAVIPPDTTIGLQ